MVTKRVRRHCIPIPFKGFCFGGTAPQSGVCQPDPFSGLENFWMPWGFGLCVEPEEFCFNFMWKFEANRSQRRGWWLERRGRSGWVSLSLWWRKGMKQCPSWAGVSQGPARDLTGFNIELPPRPYRQLWFLSDIILLTPQFKVDGIMKKSSFSYCK